MALNKDVLGFDLYTRANAYNEVDITNIEVARLEFWKNVADGIIEHFKTSGELLVPGTGLAAGSTPVTGNSITGKIQ